MEPTFWADQVVTIEPVDPAALRRRDVVLIDPFGKGAFLKRIIGLPGDTVSCAGVCVLQHNSVYRLIQPSTNSPSGNHTLGRWRRTVASLYYAQHS